MKPSTGEHVCVVGAGIVGVTIALELQRAGFRVTVVTRDPPGECCSFGAAGNFGGNVHFAIPGLAYKVPKMYFDPYHPFAFYFRDALQLAKWFRGYVRASEASEAQAIAAVFGELGRGTYDAYREWLKDVGEERLIRKGGRLFVWKTPEGFALDRYSVEFRKRQGIALEILDPGDVRDLEPGVPEGIYKGAYAPDAGYILDPLRVARLLAGAFEREGGRLVRSEVGRVVDGEVGVTVHTTEGPIDADQAVIAMGIDSRAVATGLGVRVPLVAERGYHVMFAEPPVCLRIPVMWEERKVLFTGMNMGMHVAGVAEFMAKLRPARPRFVRRLQRTTQDFFPQARFGEPTSDWSGYRPVTPDYLPVLGRPSERSRVICAYGHGHSGYQFAPGTARLVREVAERRVVSVEVLERMSPRRFDQARGRVIRPDAAATSSHSSA